MDGLGTAEIVQGPLSEALDRSTKAGGELAVTIGKLRDKLEPIMLPPAPPPTPEDQKEISHSKVVDVIEVGTDSIEASTNRLAQILERLEI